MAYDRIEPIGEIRGDYRIGLLAALTANVHRGKGVSAFRPHDFMPFVEKEKRELRSPAQAFASLAKIAKKNPRKKTKKRS